MEEPNPYAAPRSREDSPSTPRPPWRFVTWRLLWLLPATLLFAGAVHQIAEHRAVLARIARAGLPRAKVPPTMYTEHTGMALALICLGLIFVILAFRVRTADA